MHISRRTFVVTAVAGCIALTAPSMASTTGEKSMYGLIGKMRATPGQRDALIAILVEGVSSMPGCLSYVVAQDPKDPDAIWITEVWDSNESHKASLSLSSVQDAIARGRPLIAAFDEHHETVPVGGHGIGAAA